MRQTCFRVQSSKYPERAGSGIASPGTAHPCVRAAACPCTYVRSKSLFGCTRRNQVPDICEDQKKFPNGSAFREASSISTWHGFAGPRSTGGFGSLRASGFVIGAPLATSLSSHSGDLLSRALQYRKYAGVLGLWRKRWRPTAVDSLYSTPYGIPSFRSTTSAYASSGQGWMGDCVLQPASPLQAASRGPAICRGLQLARCRSDMYKSDGCGCTGHIQVR